MANPWQWGPNGPYIRYTTKNQHLKGFGWTISNSSSSRVFLEDLGDSILTSFEDFPKFALFPSFFCHDAIEVTFGFWDTRSSRSLHGSRIQVFGWLNFGSNFRDISKRKSVHLLISSKAFFSHSHGSVKHGVLFERYTSIGETHFLHFHDYDSVTVSCTAGCYEHQ